MKTKVIQIRIDEKLKKEVKDILDKAGIQMSQFIRDMFKELVKQNK